MNKVKGKTCSCLWCGKVCGNRTGLSSHMRSAHQDKTLPADGTVKPKPKRVKDPVNYCPRCGLCLATVRMVSSAS